METYLRVTVLISLCFCVSCKDQSAEVDFFIKNRLDSVILVDVKMSHYFGNAFYKVPYDSNILIDHISDNAPVHDYVKDGIFPFVGIQVKYGNQIIKRDFLIREEWEYVKVDDLYAVYTLMIDESDLNSSDD